jgi:hypothetical protein
MKRINLRGLIIVLFISILFVGCSIQYGKSKKASTSSISADTDNSLTNTYKKPYSFEKGQTIRFNYDSKVKAGVLTMKLLDSDRNLVFNFDINKNEIKDIKIERNDTYLIEVSCYKFKGSYELRWNKSEN